MLALSAGALAQISPQPPANQPPMAAGPAPVYDPQQLPVQRGQLQQFTLTPRGDIDGLILTDGTEVDTPARLSTQIAYAIRPGDMVTIHGLHAAALPLVQAVSVTDDATGRTVVDNGPPGPGGALLLRLRRSLRPKVKLGGRDRFLVSWKRKAGCGRRCTGRKAT